MPDVETITNTSEDVTPVNSSFPRDDSLCETCGYPLRGLAITGDCPECGQSIPDSSPDGRVGLPWQNRFGIGSWLQTARLMAFSPSKAFTMFRVSESSLETSAASDATQRKNWRARLFLLTIALGIAVTWYIYWQIARGYQPFRWALTAFIALLMLTYIEAAGVAYISRRRGWRVSRHLAERIACYASVGWIPAGLVLLKVFLWHTQPAMRGPFNLFHGDARDYPWMVSVGAASILWFEWLVWFGCRRLKFANGV